MQQQKKCNSLVTACYLFYKTVETLIDHLHKFVWAHTVHTHSNGKHMQYLHKMTPFTAGFGSSPQ